MATDELISRTEECLAALPLTLVTAEMVDRIWQAGFYEDDLDDSEISIQEIQPHMNTILDFLQCCHCWINSKNEHPQQDKLGMFGQVFANINIYYSYIA